MEALVGLSQHVQVILLTHHPHLIAVAEGLPIYQPELLPDRMAATLVSS